MQGVIVVKLDDAIGPELPQLHPVVLIRMFDSGFNGNKYKQ